MRKSALKIGVIPQTSEWLASLTYYELPISSKNFLLKSYLSLLFLHLLSYILCCQVGVLGGQTEARLESIPSHLQCF